MTNITIEEFRNFFIYFNEEEQQIRGVDELYELLPAEAKAQNADWMTTYRTKEEPEKEPEEEEVKQGYITAEMLNKLTGHPASSFDSVFVNDCNCLFKDTGFDRHLDAMQMLMANMMHETANFIYMKEIASGWAYEGRSDLGNTQSGDGPRYKGAGVLQLTGRFNYQRLATSIDDPKVMDGVDYVADTYPFTSARIWIEENRLLDVCLTQGFDACCRRINGGWRGYQRRLDKYQRCKQVM